MEYEWLEKFKERIYTVKSKSELSAAVNKLRIIASNRRSDEIVIELIEECMSKAELLQDFKSQVVLYGLLILQYIQQTSRMEKSSQLLREMQILAERIDYRDGLAFSYSFAWYIARIKGDRRLGTQEITKAVKLLDQVDCHDDFIYNFVKYVQAIELWTSTRNIQALEILENCVIYFLKERLYHSLSMSLGIMILIYQQTKEISKSSEFSMNVIGRLNPLNDIPNEIMSIIHFFVGFSQELSLNLSIAESYLHKSIHILRPIYKTSIYSSYYLTALSYLTSTYALQGKLELAWNQMKEVEELIEEEIATRNLDHFGKNQLKHIFNLTKFYIFSRLQNVTIEDLQELTEEILLNIDKYYSNSMFFSEFLLNASLSKKQLIKIKELNTPSTHRVEHILDFLIAKKKNPKENQILEFVSTLQKRPVEDRMTLEEKAFADLLAAQEYFKLKRYTEIYPLLRKYEKRLDEIEVLELRLFMEAFIQIGAYKNGDMMGPVNQYLAIKKCRLYKFTKLENRLLNYLDVQAKEARTNTNYIYS